MIAEISYFQYAIDSYSYIFNIEYVIFSRNLLVLYLGYKSTLQKTFIFE